MRTVQRYLLPALAVLALITVCETASSRTHAQSASVSTAPIRDAQALSTLNAALNTMQGASLATPNASPVAVVITGTYSSFTGTDTTPHPISVKVLGFDQIRWEADEPDGTYVTVFANGDGWRRAPSGSVASLAIRESVGRQLEILPLLAVADWISSPDYSCQTVGLETLNGRSVQHLAVSRPPAWTNDAQQQTQIQNLTKIDLYIDSQTNRPVRLHYNEHPRDWRVNVSIDLDFSNYQPTGGVLMPMTIDRTVEGVKVGEFQFTSVTVNASLSSSDFSN